MHHRMLMNKRRKNSKVYQSKNNSSKIKISRLKINNLLMSNNNNQLMLHLRHQQLRLQLQLLNNLQHQHQLPALPQHLLNNNRLLQLPHLSSQLPLLPLSQLQKRSKPHHQKSLKRRKRKLWRIVTLQNNNLTHQPASVIFQTETLKPFQSPKNNLINKEKRNLTHNMMIFLPKSDISTNIQIGLRKEDV